MVLFWSPYLSKCVCESACSTDSEICKDSNAPQTCVHTDAHTVAYTHIYSLTRHIHMLIPHCHILCLQGDELAVMVHFPQMDF